MVETGTLFDRISSPRDVLNETPIFHALSSADTPIFDALVTGATAGHRRSRLDDERSERVNTRVDQMYRFRRDPLTAPIPVQADTETWGPVPSRPGQSWSAAPLRPWPEHAHRTGRHRLLSTA
jgi:hypothetical protein